LAVILRKQLPPFTFLFQEKAAVLFGHKVNHAERKTCKVDPLDQKARTFDRPEWKVNPNLENLPELLQEFAGDLEKFQTCLSEFRGVVDGAITTAIESFEADLKACDRDTKFYICLITLSFSTGFPV
jgi:hypothetical protein